MSKAPILSQAMLVELERRWRDQGAPVAERLQPGLSEATIDALTEPLGLRLPAEVQRWWAWHDGVPADACELARDREIGGPGLQFFPLAEAVQQYHQARDIARDAAEFSVGPELTNPDYWWPPDWFPITSTISGAVIGCDCAQPDRATASVRAIKAGEKMAPAASFGEMVSWWLDALDAGAWRYEESSGQWDYRYDLIDRERQLTRLV